MQLSKIFIATTVAAALLANFPETADAAKKKEEDDGRVCVRLGVDTYHPLEKICTRKVATVEASKWSGDKESIHVVFLKTSDAFKAGHIQFNMAGSIDVTASELNFCVMEVPSFNGTEEQTQAHNSSLIGAHFYAIRSAGIDLAGAKSMKVINRDEDSYFPSGCDVVSATGDSWKKSWTKLVEDVSRNSGPNTKFGQNFKQGFTDALDAMSLAVSLSPADIQQGGVVAKTELQKMHGERASAREEIDQRIAAGSEEGFAFLVLESDSNMVCHQRADNDAVIEAINSHNSAPSQMSAWGVTDAKAFGSVEEVFQGVMGGQCKALMATPAELGELQDALANRSITTQTGWAFIGGGEMVAAEAVVAEARRLAEIEAQKKAEEERLAAIQREKAAAERAERERLAAIERAKTHPFKAYIYCTTQGVYLHPISCFDDTQLKITTNNRSRIYEAWQLDSAGRLTNNALYIDLPRSFALQAQNGSDLTLGVQILDQFQNVVYEDQAAKYRSVYVGND